MGLLSGIDNATGWALLQKNSAAIEKAYAAEGTDKADIAYFRKVAPSLDTPDKLLKDFRALKFVATAHGLGAQVDQTAILRKLMTQDPTASTSLAQRLADGRYREFASALSVWAPPPFSSQATIDAAVAGFRQHSFNDSVGEDSVALQEAQYFTQHAQGITKLSQIMADKPLLDVVRVSLGIPDAFSSLDYAQQKAILAPRVDLAQFASKEGVAKMVDRFLAMDQLNQFKSGGGGDPVLALFGNGNGGGGGGNSGLTLDAKTVNLVL